MELKKDARGFKGGTFTDGYGVECTIKKSSAAFEDYIWLGVNKPKLTIFKDSSKGQYIETEVPENWMVDGLMHLSRKQVAKLLPLLQNFVETGELNEPTNQPTK